MIGRKPHGYTLIYGKPIPEFDIIKLSEWFRRNHGNYHYEHEIHSWIVSTVFLGVDLGKDPSQPILWETMIFGGPYHGIKGRYTSLEEAVDGHTGVCKDLLDFGAIPAFIWNWKQKLGLFKVPKR